MLERNTDWRPVPQIPENNSIGASRQRSKLFSRSTNARQAPTSGERATNVLNPFYGQPPGYNYGGSSGASPSPNGPALRPRPTTAQAGRTRISIWPAGQIHARHGCGYHRL